MKLSQNPNYEFVRHEHRPSTRRVAVYRRKKFEKPSFDFPWALDLLKRGKAVRRKTWKPGVAIRLMGNGFCFDGLYSPYQSYNVSGESAMSKDWELA